MSVTPQVDKRPLLDLSGEQEKSDVRSAILSLLDPNNTDFTTDVENPEALTALSVLAEYSKNQLPKTAARITHAVERLNHYMIPYKRARANELIGMAEAASGASRERKVDQLRRQLFGSLAD